MQIKQKCTSLEKQARRQQELHRDAQHKDIFEEEFSRRRTITLGVCAMRKKVQSKPMKEILSRIKCREIQVVEMWSCLDHHWSIWPKVDALICFYSDGFPYLMAWKYIEKHKPFLINNLEKQQLLWDRTVVYDILEKIKVPIANHFYALHDETYIDDIENKRFGNIIPHPIELDVPNGYSLKMRSVDSSSKNYNKKLRSKQRFSFCESIENEQNKSDSKAIKHKEGSTRKQSAEFELSARKMRQEEELLETNKHCPTLLRRFMQKRVSHLKKYEIEEGEDSIIIKNGEKIQKLKKPFVQKPFDSENHEICVYYPASMGGGRKKLFRKFQDQSSQYESINEIRRDRNYIYEEFLPTNAFDIKVYAVGPYYMYAEARRSPTLDGVVLRNSEGKEIRFPVILTPTEKFICNRIVQQFGQEVCGFDLLRANGKSYVCDVNGWSFVKGSSKYWQDASFILKKKIMDHFFPEKENKSALLDKYLSENEYKPPIDNLSPKVQELRSIVSIFRHGDRSPKLKIKVKTTDKRLIHFFKGTNKEEIKFKDACSLGKVLEIIISIIAESSESDPVIKDYVQIKIVLETGCRPDGLNPKLQMKVLRRETVEGPEADEIKEIQIVLKWGGELSRAGYLDAIKLGEKMRKERYDDHDCLSLYSSYRHDVKTYSSEEGRCIKTAAAFLKGFLSIEGELAPIISSMVRADFKAQRLLDCTSSQNHSILGDQIRMKLSEIMNCSQILSKSYLEYCGEVNISEALKQIVDQIGNTRNFMQSLLDSLQRLIKAIQNIQSEMQEQQSKKRKSNYEDFTEEEVYEDILLVKGRWVKLRRDFYDHKHQKYNISKIPDIYDTIRHDLRKNKVIFEKIDQQIVEKLHTTSKLLAYFVVINEFGILCNQRLKIAQDICHPLLDKILIDLMCQREKSSTPDNLKHIRTRLYFTSASHMYALINILVLGNGKWLLNKTSPEETKRINNILFMGYLSHIEFRLYENLKLSEEDPNKFRLQISLSTEYKEGKEIGELRLGGNDLNVKEISECFKRQIK